MEKKTILSGWGNYPVCESYLSRPERYSQLKIDKGLTIARGLGRSYGDAALNTDQNVVLMERLNRLLAFNPKTGVLQVEAGTSLDDLLQVFVPRGWFLPVTPGTKFVTLGGCLAADVHGKNHHVDGNFSRYVQEIELLTANGSKIRCSPTQQPDLFWATVGGMGLTGIITEMTLQLIPIESAYMVVRQKQADNIDTLFEMMDDTTLEEKYSVAWIDCLSSGKNFGRSLLINAHHATHHELPPKIFDTFLFKSRRTTNIPFNCPSWLLNSWSVKAFNALYYNAQTKKTNPFIVDYDRYFYPLDAVANWNRLYGKRGFVQYQLVVPPQQARECIKTVLEELAKSNQASFLAVLKRFGKEGEGLLSFPREGYTLTLDIPVTSTLLPFLDHLDEIVLKNQGRLYLAKDARLHPNAFRAMYPKLEQWQQIKKIVDPQGLFSSNLSRRLKL
jgi:decaprenylphospho-beta-D-ribofuranose 2-oxidase